MVAIPPRLPMLLFLGILILLRQSLLSESQLLVPILYQIGSDCSTVARVDDGEATPELLYPRPRGLYFVDQSTSPAKQLRERKCNI